MIIKCNDEVIRREDSSEQQIYRSLLVNITETIPVGSFSFTILYISYKTFSYSVDGDIVDDRVENDFSREEVWYLISCIHFHSDT